MLSYASSIGSVTQDYASSRKYVKQLKYYKINVKEEVKLCTKITTNLPNCFSPRLPQLYGSSGHTHSKQLRSRIVP